jgi:hypothetical protein
MPTLQELTAKTASISEFAQSDLWPMVDDFEANNVVDLSKLKSRAVIAGPMMVGGWLMQLLLKKGAHSSMPIKAFALLSFAAMLIGGIMIAIELVPFLKQAGKRAAALSKLKREIKQKAIHFLDPTFTLDSQVAFPGELHDTCGLFETDYDRATAEDRCRGSVGETAFEIYELNTQKVKKTRGSDGKTRTTYIRVFKGLMLIADANKNFNGHTTVATDKTEKSFGFLARQGQRLMSSMSKLKLVELESPEFEALFKVRSTDAVEARYLLTPKFMESFVNLKRKHGVDLQIAFLNSKVILMIPRDGDFLELRSGIQDLTMSVESMLRELVEVLQVIDDLDLNNRIYNKTKKAVGGTL